MPNWLNRKTFFLYTELRHIKTKINSHAPTGVRTSILIFRLIQDYASRGTPWM